MERDDQSRQIPEAHEEVSDQKRHRSESEVSRPHWKEIFKLSTDRILRMTRTLWRGTKHTYITLFKSDGDISPLDDIKGAFGHISIRKKGLGYIFIALSFFVYLLSGVYTVEPGEEAVARVFGKEISQPITEGLHYRLPWPFEAIEKVNVMEIKTVDVGIPTSQDPLLFPRQKTAPPLSEGRQSGHSGHGGHGGDSNKVKTSAQNPVSAKNQFFTGDENILEIRMNIQYRVKDASDYLFKVNSPDSLIPYASRAAITEIFGGMKVDNLLTTAKSQIQKRIALKTQRMLDEYGVGLHIINVNLQEVKPPKEVAQAFRDVASAREEKEETINKAQGYWNVVIPEARGKAYRTISDGEGYRQEVINRARGDAERFATMLMEYQKAKDITEYRLYLETIERVLARTKKFIIDSKKERVNLKFTN